MAPHPRLQARSEVLEKSSQIFQAYGGVAGGPRSPLPVYGAAAAALDKVWLPEESGPAQVGVAADWRAKPVIMTFTGRYFHPLDPDPAEVCIEDIAHGLSQVCRYAGQCLRFYSVAEHSVLLACHFERKLQDSGYEQARREGWALQALLHDAAEAYLPDVPSTIKDFLPGFKALERRVEEAVQTAFGLTFAGSDCYPVQAADRSIRVDEAAAVCHANFPVAALGPALGVQVDGWMPEQAEREFLTAFRRLSLARWHTVHNQQ